MFDPEMITGSLVSLSTLSLGSGSMGIFANFEFAMNCGDMANAICRDGLNLTPKGLCVHVNHSLWSNFMYEYFFKDFMTDLYL